MQKNAYSRRAKQISVLQRILIACLPAGKPLVLELVCIVNQVAREFNGVVKWPCTKICTFTGGRLTKIKVPQESAALWRQVLQSPITVPQWEVFHRYNDVRALLVLDLITVRTGSYPQSEIDLVDKTLRLNEKQVKVLIGLSSYGMCRENFLAWARIMKIEDPLPVIKSLTDLDIVVVTTRNGLVTFLLR
ncbi:MAG: hypothetical protein UW16_C0031G0002 [Microgenomates group bacterium GW2011_GWC1_44_10]|nr:MAG: hypothetical protein UW16_C0031G0002 [Microgenomates group bacterium GW2011_GWC1_44_10]